MGATIVNWGLGISLLGTIIIVGVALNSDPIKAFRARKGGLEFDDELFGRLGRRIRWGIIVGVIVLGIGTLVQMTGNLLN
jgi:hypothetical protein